jgi:hypothetical protein
LILASAVPSQPDSPITTVDASDGSLVIAWTAPTSTGGTGVAITKLEILIETKSGTLITSTQCDGASSAIIAASQCKVTMSSLLVGSFFLVQSDSVKAKIRMENVIGWSVFSDLTPTLTAATVQVVPYGLQAPI